MSRSSLDTGRSFSLRSRVGHGSTGSSPLRYPCLPGSLKRASGSSTILKTGSSWPNRESSCAITGIWWSGISAVGALGQLGKEQVLHYAENLFSLRGVKLSEHQSYARPSIGVSLPGSPVSPCTGLGVHMA